MSARLRVCWLLLLAALGSGVPAASAAEFEIVPGSVSLRAVDAAGLPDNRAGAHPDRLQIDFAVSMVETGTTARDFVFELPPGVGGNPGAVAACPRSTYPEKECPPSSRIGTFEVTTPQAEEPQPFPLFNIEPAPGQFAQFGSQFIAAKMAVSTSLRPGDHGLTLGLEDQIHLPISAGRIELWGVPADHQEEVTGPRLPFLTTPTRCGPMALTFRTRSWMEGAPWLSATAFSAPLEDCGRLPFEPRQSFALTDPVADAPTGIEAKLTVPQHDDPDALVASQLRSASLEMPPGMAVSPAGVKGLTACTDAEFGLGDGEKPSCPFASKVGSVTIDSVQAREPLGGDIFLGRERPGERFRLLVAASGPGVVVKLAGALRVNSAGRIAVSLEDLPQLPIGSLTLRMNGGARALLTTPLSCGPVAAGATFDPYSGTAPVVSMASLTIAPRTPGAQCTGPAFAPGLVAGSTRPKAGQRTSFSMTLNRDDGEQLVDRFGVELPAGLSPALGAVERCDAAAVAAVACQPSSRIGSAVAEVGSGPNPARIDGAAYLTGPYRHAPFGLALVLDAAIGPFDLGEFVVRGKVEVDPLSGRASIQTDPLPAAFEGIPLRFQMLGLDLDRPGFLRNPTSCAPTKVAATIRSQTGAAAIAETPFRLRGCDKLRFRPALAMSLGRRAELRRHGRPDLRLSAKLRPRDANLRALEVSLPSTLRFEVSRLKEICARDDALKGRCPRGSRIGGSWVRTPLLGKALRGPVFVVQPKGNGSPDLWASVDGLGVNLNLRAETSARDGRLTVDLSELPDMPMSAFAMRLDGGKSGVLTLRRGVCGKRAPRAVSPAVVKGHNGAERKLRVPVTCASKRPPSR